MFIGEELRTWTEQCTHTMSYSPCNLCLSACLCIVYISNVACPYIMAALHELGMRNTKLATCKQVLQDISKPNITYIRKSDPHHYSVLIKHTHFHSS